MVTVIMPTYNREELIGRAIESVINQTYNDWELIIVDDAGQDNTRSVVKRYQAKDSRIRYFRKTKNGGPSSARNVGLKVGKGDYFAFLDSDDEWTSRHLEECLDALEKTNYSACSSLWLEIKNGTPYEVSHYEWFEDHIKRAQGRYDIGHDKELWIFDERFYEYVVCTGFFSFHINTLVLKREVIEKIGYFNTKLCSNEDLDFEYRVIEHFPLVTVNQIHYLYHYGNNNIYAFVDRLNVDREEFLKNTYYCKKHSRNMEYKIVMYEHIYRRVMENPHISDKQNTKRKLKEFLFKRCLTVAITNKEIDKQKSIVYFVRAFRYAYNFDMIHILLAFWHGENKDKYFCYD